jgi:hypothetical protein
MQLWTGLVDFQGFAVEVGAVQGDNCLSRCGVVPHLNKSEASRHAGPVVGHYFQPPNRAVPSKYGPNVLFGDARTEISNEGIVHKVPSFLAGDIRDGRFCGLKNSLPLGSWWEMPHSV